MAYNVKSSQAIEFIDDMEIVQTMEQAKEKAKDQDYILSLIAQAADYRGLNHQEAAVLSYVDDQELLQKIFAVAQKIKNHIYGKRIVMFAPLYISDYCINGCTYCGYSAECDIKRSRLSQEELIREVEILESMGHKRLALETGEDPENCPLEYVLQCIETIYGIKNKNGSIRRVNVNVAATTVEDYRRLKEAGIGT
ncbi:MAG: hypothetical protein RR396_03015 [Clostridiales bacterium]